MKTTIETRDLQEMRPPIIPLQLPPGTARPVTSESSLLFPTDVIGLREAAQEAVERAIAKRDEQAHVIHTYEQALQEMQARVRLLVGLVWVLGGLTLTMMSLFVWRLW